MKKLLLMFNVLFLVIALYLGCMALDKRLGCMTYENVYCDGRWVCDNDPLDNCQICECMPFWGPDGEPPWQAGY